MQSFFEPPDFAGFPRGGVHPFATPEAIAQRDRERIADGMLPTAEERLRALRRHAAALAQLPERDSRSVEEILGYDDDGLPS